MSEQPGSVDLGEVFRSLANHAVTDLRTEYQDVNQAALVCIRHEDGMAEIRTETIRHFLDRYGVLRGFTTEVRLELAKAVIEWASQQQDLDKFPLTYIEIIDKQEALESFCRSRYGAERSFASLASKALWLCYPDSVPILDRFAERAVQTLSKLATSIQEPTGARNTRYGLFAYYWLELFRRYGSCLDDASSGVVGSVHLHKPKIFDWILLVIGDPAYRRRGM